MQLNLETDYGIRCVMYLAEHDACISSQELSENLGLHSIEHVQKIVRKLRDAGIVSVKRGCGGGYFLSRNASEISVKEVLDALEESNCVNRCLMEDCYCSRDAVNWCPMRVYYEKLQELNDAVMRDTSMQDVLDGKFHAFPDMDKKEDR